MLRKLLALGLVSIRFATWNVKPSLASEQDKCFAAISEMTSKIQDGRGVLVFGKIANLSKDYAQGYPTDRLFNYQFILDGDGNQAVLSSKQFLSIIATRIIKSCSSINSVTFAPSNSGWGVTIGILSDGSIKAFDCIENGEGLKHLKWGQEPCGD